MTDPTQPASPHDADEASTSEEPEVEEPAPRIVAFDIGEVLIDETRVWAVWADLLGISPLSFAAVLGAAIAQGSDHREVFPHVAPNIDAQELVGEHERRYGGFQDQDLYPDVRPCLQELSDLGFAVVLAGNQPSRRTAQLLALDLPHDRVATSEELGVEKPDEAFFAALVELTGAADPAEILYVGDRVDNDVAPAAAFGMRTCWLRRGPWGQLQDLPDGLEPDLSLESLGELSQLLADWRDG